MLAIILISSAEDRPKLMERKVFLPPLPHPQTQFCVSAPLVLLRVELTVCEAVSQGPAFIHLSNVWLSVCCGPGSREGECGGIGGSVQGKLDLGGPLHPPGLPSSKQLLHLTGRGLRSGAGTSRWG